MNILRISDASSLALHAMAFLANHGPEKTVSVKEISEFYKVSEAHLSKVIQRLSKQGLVLTHRGPKGGVELGRGADEITLAEVFEAIEGPLGDSKCLLGRDECLFDSCLLGGLLKSVNNEVKEYFSATTLQMLADTIAKGAEA